MKFHPDRNPEDPSAAEAKFKEASEAYEVLCDPRKSRRVYDQFGHAGLDPNGMGGARGRREFFRHLQRRVRRHLRRLAAAAVRSLEAPTCVTRSSSSSKRRCEARPSRFAYRCSRRATNVKAAARAKGRTRRQCADCGGAGQIRVSQGFFSLQQTCPRCRGAGSRDQGSVPTVRRQRSRRTAQDAICENPAWRRHRRPDPAQRRR